MIVTEFLTEKDYYKYGDWLNDQDTDTRYMFFGVANGAGLVESLIDRIEANPEKHKFLVAKNCNGWLGVLHIAEISSTAVEFGIIVEKNLRGEGIGSMLIEEALVWARNRGYRELFMHCLNRNLAIKHLCEKHGLESRNIGGESQVEMDIGPASLITLNKEIRIKQRNLFHMFLQNSQNLYKEIYG